MVQVIQRREDAKEAPVIEFAVGSVGYPPKTVGIMRFERPGPSPGFVSIIGNRFASVETAWLQTLSLAERLGIEFILIVDPRGLFPPERRPAPR